MIQVSDLNHRILFGANLYNTNLILVILNCTKLHWATLRHADFQ
ncbi:MAG TPA: hypothetical protein DCG18_00810 [Richelia sp.]|nr:hypothetical protein [Richelia sp.]